MLRDLGLTVYSLGFTVYGLRITVVRGSIGREYSYIRCVEMRIIKAIFLYTLIVYMIFIVVENKEILFHVVFMFVRLIVLFSRCKATQCFIMIH